MMISVINICLVLAIAFLGGLLNTVAGFGGGIFVMLLWPLFLPMLQASALSTLVLLVNSAMLAWRYREHIRWKLVLSPLIFYFAVSYVAIQIATTIDVRSLKALFGLFLVLLGVYFLLFSDRVHIRPTIPSAALCASLSALASGMFGCGGVPMALYLLTVTESKMAYIGTVQMFSAITGSYNTMVRISRGVFSKELLILAIPGIFGIWCGKQLGLRLVEKLNMELLKKIIYFFVAISGLVLMFTNLSVLSIFR